jgi:hypothetical protein
MINVEALALLSLLTLHIDSIVPPIMNTALLVCDTLIAAVADKEATAEPISSSFGNSFMRVFLIYLMGSIYCRFFVFNRF